MKGLPNDVLLQAEVEVEEVPPGQKAYVGLFQRGSGELADCESFQDFDVFRAEVGRLLVAGVEALKSDRSGEKSHACSFIAGRAMQN